MNNVSNINIFKPTTISENPIQMLVFKATKYVEYIKINVEKFLIEKCINNAAYCEECYQF